MPQPVPPKDFDVVIKFGGGLHTRASEDEIDPREAHDGANFLLDLENRELKPRPPFDLIGQVPNGEEIRGGGSFRMADGTVKAFVQAGDSVYSWDGSTGFTLIASVSATAQLRGHHRSHTWALDDKLLVTDINLAEVVQEWDGTTFQDVAFLNNTDSGSSFGNFFAKYLDVSNERAIFSHVKDAGQTSPHMMVGSMRGEYTVISVSNRPASSLSEEDPFFLLSPDLRPINGHVGAFGTTVVSTEQGQLFNLSGSSAKDFAFEEFYPGSAASGDESVAYIGNDIIYGRQGRVESVRDTDRFGDAETDDKTKGVSDMVSGYSGWRIVYNSRLNRVYLFPEGVSEVWVAQTSMFDGEVSPWMKWTTNHGLAFQPTFVMSMLDPSDGLEYVFMGDDAGNFYRTEGTGTEGDAGITAIPLEWVTKLFSAPLDLEVNRIEGYIKYRKNLAFNVDLVFEFTGQTAFNETVQVEVPAISGAPHFGGDHYFGGDVYFGAPFENRILRQKFFVAGQAPEFQIRVQVESANAYNINEIGLRFTGASK